jgi:hypothetical protein
MPTYSKDELKEWMLSQKEYHRLHAEWVESGHDKDKAPSCDRIDDYKGYSFDNIRIVTWGENSRKYDSDRVNGVNNKESLEVFQYSKTGEFIQSFHSRREAGRKTGAHPQLISKCTKGKLR